MPEQEGALTMRTIARTLIAASFLLAGLAETLSSTGLVLELSPKVFWALEPRTLPLGGPVQIAGAVLLFSGRKTAWALALLLCYLILATIFGNLPHLMSPETGDAALAGLVSNMAVVGGMLYWFQVERAPRRRRSVGNSVPMAKTPERIQLRQSGLSTDFVAIPGRAARTPWSTKQ